MILQRFAQFLLKRRTNAILIALLFSIVGFLRWIGSVVAGFVTIRKGPWEGGLVFLWTFLPIIVLWTLQPQFWFYLTVYIVTQVIFWLMATTMMYRQEYRPCLYVVTAGGILGLIVFIALVSDVNQWIIQHMTMLINQEKQALSSAQINEIQAYRDQFKTFAQNYPALATMFGCGFPALLMGLWITVNLLIARMLDRSLVNPEQFSQEFGLIHIPYIYSIGVLAIVAISVYIESGILMALLPLLTFPLIMAGVSLIHYLILNTNMPNFLLFVFYLILVIGLLTMVALPIMALIFIFVALIDSVFDFRGRLSSIF